MSLGMVTLQALALALPFKASKWQDQGLKCQGQDYQGQGLTSLSQTMDFELVQIPGAAFVNGSLNQLATKASYTLFNLLLQDMFSNLVFQVFRAYTFDANDNSFRFLILQSDWTRFQPQMIWTLWNPYTINKFMSAVASPYESPINSFCLASGWSIVKTYSSTATSEAISVSQQQVHEVGHVNITIRSSQSS